ncbi:MAG TPA: CdaR family protein [Vicinamibacterales bacterium]|jgi:YbbR domain-containing protein
MRAIWPFRHIGLKLLSVAIAVLLWMVIAGEETVERGLRVPLELQQFPPGLELLGDVPTTADVRVRGASGTLSRVSPGDIVAVLDLRGARAGERLFHLTPEQVRAPFGVEVIQVTPPTVAVAFEKSASKNVPIKPAIDGKPAAGYIVGKITAEPPTVEVVGPESAVRRVTEALTEPVSVAGALRPVQETVTVGTLDSAVRVKTQRTAKVTVQIVPAPLEQMVRDRPVHIRNLAATLTATVIPSEVDVTLRGSREALARVRPDDATAFVDLGDLGAGEYTVTVGAESSRDAGVARIDPAAVAVRITSAKN